MNDRFLNACRRQPVDATPIWLMRQAGRYMEEYRAVRAKHTMLDVIRTPELACEVTMQPINAFDLDAAIIFSDILPILMGMGLDLDFVKGEGPKVFTPIESPADVDALATPPAEEALHFTLDAIKLTVNELAGKVPLIGFSGAPFTLASYAIEGGGAKNYIKAKSFMVSESAAWHRLMEKLVTTVSDYMIAQVHAGAAALQLFDSWAGVLASGDYREYVLPYNIAIVQNIRAAVDVPIIYFGTNLNGMLPTITEIPADVLGVDWHIPLDEAWNVFGDGFAVQGNLDPVLLFAPWEEIQRRVDDILARAAGKPGHIFNLGHGILPKTPVDNVRRLVDYVHEQSERIAAR